jgi:hypothetical protein
VRTVDIHACIAIWRHEGVCAQVERTEIGTMMMMMTMIDHDRRIMKTFGIFHNHGETSRL